jgi:hypothetical protein
VWQALDVNFLLRKAATVSTPVMEVSEEDGVWTIKTSTTLKSMELKFKVRFAQCCGTGTGTGTVGTVTF